MDLIFGEGKTQVAVEFCIQFGMASRWSFTTVVYGERVATLLATFWCHKMEYLLNIWFSWDNPDTVFSEDDLAGYLEPRWLAPLMKSFDLAQISFMYCGPALLRIVEIRAMRPCDLFQAMNP